MECKFTDKFDYIVNKHGFTKLMPIQKKFQQYIAGKGTKNNLIVSAPTTSGKTLIAEILIAERSNSGTAIIYIAPMLSILREKRQEFELMLTSSVKICYHTNQFEDNRANLLLTTPENLFDVLKHNPRSLENLELVIIDEGHLLADNNRGYTIDTTITLLKESFRKVQFLVMSATIGFAKELQEWLGADFIEDKYRDIKLERRIEVSADRTRDIISEVDAIISKGKSIAIFRSSKANVQGLAKNLLNAKIYT